MPAGSRVVIALPNTAEMIYALYGASAARMVVVPLDPRLRPRNIDHVLAHTEPALVIAEARDLEIYARCKASGNHACLLVCMGPAPSTIDVPFIPFDELLAAEPTDLALPAGGDPAAILYTTGTTGLRKGAVLTHRSLLAATQNINTFTRLGPAPTELIAMPLTHSFGFGRLRCAFALHGTVVLQRDWTRPTKFFELMIEHAVSSVGLVPAACRMVVDHYAQPFASAGTTLRWIELGSDFLERKYKEALIEMFPAARVCMHYGLTEASRSTFIEFHSERSHLDTIGRPTPGVEICVTDEAGHRCPPNTTGEIRIKADTLLSRYGRNDEQTDAALDGGWLKTGDLARMDEDGYLSLVGRKTDTFKIGGLSVAPREIEEVLGSYPDVADAAAAALPSTSGITGVELHAWLVPTRDQTLDLTELRKFCISHLEPHKVPHTFHIVTRLPRTSSGKLQRGELVRGFAPAADLEGG
jgi:long-chain acyl-CoA synthetase